MYLDPYIAQASPGDILLLSDSHPAFYLNKGLTLIGLGQPTPTNTGTVIGDINKTFVSVPPGERATLIGFLHAYASPGPGSASGLEVGLNLLGGEVAIADVVCNSGIIQYAGNSILERVQITGGGGLQIYDGVCAATECSSIGHAFAIGGVVDPGVTVGQPAGGTPRFVASRLTATGGAGGVGGMFNVSGAPGLRVGNGFVYLTDSTLIGGAAGGGPSGGAALASNGAVTAIARTALIDGAGATGTSTGYQIDDAMVGMSCPSPPTRGASFTVTATAGNSAGLLGIVGGFDRTANVLPPVVEPLFGMPTQLVVLAVALPLPAAQIPVTIQVPNVATLLGAEVWLQALQLAGPSIRASTVVGGPIR